MDLPLLQWLEKYTFPTESRFSDLEFARNVYSKSVRRHLRNGTTFACYFATIHNSAAKVLVDVIADAGQRAFVGKVSMDRNSPDFYIEETKKGLEDAEEFVRFVISRSEVGREFIARVDSNSARAAAAHESTPFPENGSPDTLLNQRDSPLILPCITPRFVPTCTEAMMRGLSIFSRKYGVPLQSHLSESIGEIEWVKSLHPSCESYTDVYLRFGSLHRAAFMAHCVHSDKREREVLKETGTGVIHCASSNFMLESGIMDARVYVGEGLKVALGTDVAGGYSASMLDALRQTIIASKCHVIAHKKSASRDSVAESYAAISYKEAFHLATVGGAEVLGMGDVIGNFNPQKQLDCLIVDYEVSGSPLDIFGTESVLEKFQKFLFLGDDRNITSVFVNGRQVV